MGIDAFGLKAALQSLDEGLVGDLPCSQKVQRAAALRDPQATIALHELAALIVTGMSSHVRSDQ
ncbi:hypothetical protein XH99_13955 [Bradyrhizobium nanningense]|uniref:Uncharacterized protein n=1 Tax=Bradyrhizobium nanningense TaxID=1325118 RepID=A0A4Q0S5R7_9BRAD|nr:hypothetical protein XH99_13955 [Bradyrhizobium nanningense]